MCHSHPGPDHPIYAFCIAGMIGMWHSSELLLIEVGAGSLELFAQVGFELQFFLSLPPK
jgi:hypothetical protein